ncbi:hypothetical protein QF028_005584 [Neobacillus sp. B4I6]
MSIGGVTKDKTPQVNKKNVYRRGSEGQSPTSGQEKCLSGGVPKDKTPQVNMENVYRRGSEGQSPTSEQEKCLSEGFRRTKPHQWTGKMSIVKVPKDKTPQVNRKNVHRRGSEGQCPTSGQEKCLSEGFRRTKPHKWTGKMSIGRGSEGQNPDKNT